MPERSPVGFGRRDRRSACGRRDRRRAPVAGGCDRLDDDLAPSLLPERPARGHKGSFGKLLVIAGSLDYAGAALLVCRAAGRAGVGLVTLAVPESLQPLFAAKVVEATTMGLPEDDVEEIDPEPALARILDHEHDALVVGPGLRPGLATAELVRQLIVAPGREPPPIVLDAEALRSLATMDGWWEGERRPAVLTPHAGEFARLRAGSGVDPETTATSSTTTMRESPPRAMPRRAWQQVVVLKGARTVIAAPDGEVAIAPFENPALATGGTGDVLAGAIGALLAQGLAPFAAARLGVYLHGASGRRGPRPVRRRRPARLGPARRAGHRPKAPGRPRRTATGRQAARLRLARAHRGRRRGREPATGRGTRVRVRRVQLDRDPPGGCRPAAAAAHRLARARPRRAPRQPRASCRTWPAGRAGPSGGQGRCLRPRGRAVALALEAAGADGFCVAAMDEALALRAGGVRAPDPGPLSDPGRRFAAEAARAGITVPAGDRGSWTACSRRPGTPPRRLHARAGPLRIELEVETGLGRDGFPRSARRGRARRSARPAAPSWPASGPTCRPRRTQPEPATSCERFDAAATLLRDAGLVLPPRHVAASGGLFTDVAALDGVRPGLAVYGIVPDELDGTGLAPEPPRHSAQSCRCIARPIRVADLPAGHGISYGPTFTTERPSRIATLPLGYGDGYARDSRTGQRRSCAASAPRSSGTSPWTRS